MLVKLGNAWINPAIVAAIFPETGSYCCNIILNNFGSAERVFLRKAGSYDEAIDFCDKYASIVNTAVGSSYGGEDAEVKEI